MLNKSYPFLPSYTVALKISFWVGLFIFLFLFIFQPFGLSSVPGNKLLIIAGYGLISFTITGLTLISIAIFFKEHQWTILHQIFFYLVLLSFISLANFYYTQNLFPSFNYNPFGFILYTLAVGIFPIIFLTIVYQNFLNKNHTIESDKVNQALQSITGQTASSIETISFKSTQGQQLTIEQKNILFIESTANYLEVYYLQDDKMNTDKFRGTLKALLEKLNPTFRKTHRAYVVNTQYIEQATGNAQGLKLSLKESNMSVPVSRTYVKEFRSYLES